MSGTGQGGAGKFSLLSRQRVRTEANSCACHFSTGIEHFDELLERAAQRAPASDLVSIEDVSATTGFLATDYARLMTGKTVYVEEGIISSVSGRAEVRP